MYSSSITGDVENVIISSDAGENVGSTPTVDTREAHPVLDTSFVEDHTHAKDIEEAVMPDVGEAVAAPPESYEALQTFEEMSTVTPTENDDLMNQE